MSVKNQHSDYTKMLNKWQRCADVRDGQDAVHGAGTTYLPQLKDQDNDEYASYKKRATFYNATWRTIAGLQGMLFRKPPKVVVPDLVVPMLKNVDLAGTPLHIFALCAAEECLTFGRLGIWVDYPEVNTEMATQADARRENFRPSMKMYKAMSIINWKTATVRNETLLSLVVIKEMVDKPVDEFTDEPKIQYRVLDLALNPDVDPSVANLVYRVRTFEVVEENGKEIDKELTRSYPKINGKYLDKIPFRFIGVDDVSWDIDEPPLIDLVDMNLSHYLTNADYEHGCHFTGLPTPIISGFIPNDPNSPDRFYIGSTTAWVFPNPMAKASYLEFTGQGLTALRENLDKKEAQMAILGARMLEVSVRKTESANTAAIHRGGEQSMLSSVAQAISIGMQQILEVFCEFAGATTNPDDVQFELNRDFFPVPMDALTLTAIIAGWQNGAYSYDTMFANLKKGEIVLPEQTAEQEHKDIAENPPPAVDAPTTPGNASPKGPKAAATPATPAPTIKQLQDKGGQ